MEKIYHCENCGRMMEFDPKSQTLKCPGCGTSIEIADYKDRIREHQMNAAARKRIRAGEKSSHTMECQGCGAKIEVEAVSTSAECPYCGSKYVLADKQEDALIPDGVIPFQFDKQEAGSRFQDWVKRRFWAPGKLKHLYQKDKLQGLYLPYWTFDAQAEGSYTGRGGTTHVHTYEGEDGKRHTRTEVTWTFVHGYLEHFFDDELIPASDKLDGDLLEGMDGFDTAGLVSYAPEYMSGYASECFTVDLEEAYRRAHREMEEHLREMAREEILRRYDQADSIHVEAGFEKETFKHVLLPVYSTAYAYRNKVYHVLINGQNGEVAGEYPKSFLKIAVCILIIIALSLLLYYFLY